eukprot:5065504-Amphidinium_carterae.1
MFGGVSLRASHTSPRTLCCTRLQGPLSIKGDRSPGVGMPMQTKRQSGMILPVAVCNGKVSEMRVVKNEGSKYGLRKPSQTR